MTMRILVRVVSSLALLSLAAPARPSTVAPPANLGVLARLSHSVVLARAIASATDASRPSFPWTATQFERLRTVAGDTLPETFVVHEPGGVGPKGGLAIGGAPVYQPARTYLLFLDRTRDGRLSARMMAYGLLVEDEASGLLVPLAEAEEIDLLAPSTFEPVTAYDEELLLAHLSEVAKGGAWSAARAGSVPMSALAPPPAGCQYLTSDTDFLPVRWFGYETASTTSQIRHTTPGQSGIADGGVGAVTQGAAAWTNHPDSIIRLAYAGSAPAAVNCADGAELNAVWFNDPCGDIPDLVSCAGTLAFGGAFFSAATFNYDGVQWHQAGGTAIVVNNGTQCIGDVSFREMLTHELGHTQGFGHHAAAPAPNNPTMSALLKADGRGASLVGVDKSCASHAYHTFYDVPYSHVGWRFVEAVENAGVTNGCNNGLYCPDAAVTREQMAVFLLLSREGPAYSPPPCVVPPFADVPVSSPYCKWIRELVARGVTAGCGAGVYCPQSPVTREQMAVFLLRTKDGAAYVPPACVVPAFTDVPCSSGFAAWIHEIVRRGISGGCAPNLFCPTGPNTRVQMAVFLTTTFGLALPN